MLTNRKLRHRLVGYIGGRACRGRVCLVVKAGSVGAMFPSTGSGNGELVTPEAELALGESVLLWKPGGGGRCSRGQAQGTVGCESRAGVA
jgi:hypothetical protein